jgi:hypothetical protein
VNTCGDAVIELLPSWDWAAKPSTFTVGGN